MQIFTDPENPYNEDQLDLAARFGLQIEKELFTNFPNLKEY